jgi:FtsH-binding integral membrane protein
MLFFLLWWCFDDHLAVAMNNPNIGTLPWWLVLLVGICLSPITYRDASYTRR